MDEAALRQLHVFDGLSRKQRRLLASRADELEVSPGKMLCSKGETAHQFFVIEDGTAKVMRDGQYLDELGPGDFFGEMGLLDNAPRNADVVAKTPLRLMVLSGRALRDLERAAPGFARRLSRSVEQRRHWLEPVS
jgi:CRP/FNR family transcriptional regulator, cyclic AMP receptor protein